MRIIAAVVLAAIATLGLAVAPAFAKGPTAATVEGPGIDGRHLVFPEGDYAELGRLTEVTGFWNAFSDQGLAAEPPVPEADLGPRYTVRWQMGSSWLETFVYPFASTPAMRLPEAAARATGRNRGGWTTGSSEVRSVFETYGAAASAAPSTTAQSKATDSTADADAAVKSGVKSGGAATSSSSGGPDVAPFAVGGAALFLLAGASVLLRRRARAPRAVLRH
ncbi:hypothetical protein [Nocardioides astragali]|uniref:LPXTG cell wall anchor domain-containing protein n=1 Tax=Nocardioides astragali TaxID=1776736 RepID=A0ABW2N1E1_9ACTN|nr:hypothetical protein [Nocardioides astragali]